MNRHAFSIKTFCFISAFMITTTSMLAADHQPTASSESIANSTPEKTLSPNTPQGFEITPALEQSVAQGLRFLETQQNPDGSFGQSSHPVAITSLCALAMMSHGDLPNRGYYGPAIEKALEYILSQVHESGFIAAPNASHAMYGHGFAVLFLGEVYGMTQNPRVRDALVRSVNLIAKSQNSDGGWRYQPIVADADISISICQIMGLRSARNAGIKVPYKVIRQGVAYVRSCQNPDGGFSYVRNNNGPRHLNTNSGYARSAAGIATLYYAGIYEGEEIDRGLEYLTSYQPGPQGKSASYFYYGHYYGTQAMYLAGAQYWTAWFKAIRNALLERQSNEGSWDSHHGPCYATALSLIILQMPNRYLPIFDR